jgi:hypothetical protein
MLLLHTPLVMETVPGGQWRLQVHAASGESTPPQPIFLNESMQLHAERGVPCAWALPATKDAGDGAGSLPTTRGEGGMLRQHELEVGTPNATSFADDVGDGWAGHGAGGRSHHR